MNISFHFFDAKKKRAYFNTLCMRAAQLCARAIGKTERSFYELCGPTNTP